MKEDLLAKMSLDELHKLMMAATNELLLLHRDQQKSIAKKVKQQEIELIHKVIMAKSTRK